MLHLAAFVVMGAFMRSAPTLSPTASGGSRAAVARAAVVASAAATESLLGEVVSVSGDGLIAIRPGQRELARVGSMLRFGGGGLGAIVSERCGFYFAAAVEGAAPGSSESATLLPRNLTVDAWDGSAASWGGLHDFLSRPAAAASTAAAAEDGVDVFSDPVPAARRRPIGSSLHTGVVAIDALAPIGRGQSMMLFGPDALPAGSGRTDLALRIVLAQHALDSDVRSVLVLTEGAAERARAIEALKEAGALESTRVLEATTPLEAIVAASAACSVAEACEGEDVLVVVDNLRLHLQLWKAICGALSDNGVPVGPEEEGSQQRAYYSRLVERAARRKPTSDTAAEAGSVSLILLQPSVSVRPSAADLKAEYTLADFEGGGFTNKVCERVKMLSDKGIPITEDVLIKVGIPLPGSDHPVAGRGQRSAQHLEELTSLVDGHIDLRESLAASGHVPPIDPSNSLTRIGVGSTKLRPLSATPAMAAVSSALRLDLAAASDPGNFDPQEKRRAAAYMAVLHQPAPTPLSLGEEVTLLYAASRGLLDEPVAAVGEEGVAPLLARLLDHVRASEPDVLETISRKGLLSDYAMGRIDALVREAMEMD